MRQLKYSEKKLLKHTDFLKWKVDDNLRENHVMQKFFIQKRDHYLLYNKMSRDVQNLVNKILNLEEKDPYRIEASGKLLEKLYSFGVIGTKWSLQHCRKVTASSFCRRRLPCIMKRSRMVPTLKAAVTFIEQGHVRVGTEIVKDPAMLITRNMEDYVTWVNASAIRKHVKEYNEERDDFDLNSC